MEEAFDIRASVRYAPMSPQKVRLVLDIIRGLDVTEALDVLRFTQKAAARTVLKFNKFGDIKCRGELWFQPG